MKAKRVVASGATPWAKEDLKDEFFLYQHKEVFTAKSHGVKIGDLEQLRRNAIDEGLAACYIIEYQGRRWFMTPDETWDTLRDDAQWR